MIALMQRHVASASCCGIFILTLAVCFQLLGVPGTLLNFVDFEDACQASITVGYTVTSSSVSLFPYLTRVFASDDNTTVNAFLCSDALFHPPLFL